MRPIKLFWYDNKPNFGDALAPEIVGYAAKRPVIWAEPHDAALFSTGSLYDFIQHRGIQGKPGAHIWGSGTLGPMKNPFWRGVFIHAQRGPLTRLTTMSTCACHGDPGLLYPLVYGESIVASERAIFIPHKRHVAHAYRFFEDACPVDLEIVNPATREHHAVARAIAQSRLVFSSSLHGLILADAFGVPNIWVNPNGIHRWPYWKFIDYFLSVGRPVRKPVSMDQINTLSAREMVFDPGLSHRIEKRQKALLAAFPVHLAG